MSNIPKSFVMVLRRRYRLYFNPQSGTWYAAFGGEGGRERRSLGVRTRPEAEEAVRRMDCPPAADPVHGRIPWGEFQTGFLSYKASSGKAPKTIKRYEAAMQAFGRFLTSKSLRHLDEVTLPVLDGYIAYRTGKEGCDAKTAYTDALVLKGAFKWAAKPGRRLIPSNPAADWEISEPVKPKRPGYTPQQVEKMETGVRSWLRPIVTTLAWTGMRIDELINLRWSDVDFERHVLHVRVQEAWKPKGRRDRTVPLHPKVEAVLRGQPLGRHVFAGPCGGRLKENYTLVCLKRDQRALGLAEGDLHGFRRFFATTMMRAGVDVETVRQWGGWKSLDTMLRYLADVSVEDSVQAMENAAKRLTGS